MRNTNQDEVTVWHRYWLQNNQTFSKTNHATSCMVNVNVND